MVQKTIWKEGKKRDDYVAMGISILTHLLLLLVVVRLTIAEPKLDEEEIESFDVMLGETEDGSGQGTNVDPQEARYIGPRDNPNPLPPAESHSSSSSSSRQTISDPRGVAIRQTPSDNNTGQSNTRPATRTGEGNANTTQNPRAVFGDRNSGTGVGRGRGNGQGEGNGSGIQGDPSGSMQYSLSSRKLINSPSKFGSFSQNGTVKMVIYVDRNGRIIRHRITSSTASELSRIAEQKLSEVRFNTDNTAPPEQQGSITFKFKLR